MSFWEVVASQDRNKVLQAIQDGAPIDIPDPETGLTPLMIACCQAGKEALEIITLLVDAGAKVNHVRESDGMTALKLAALHSSGAAVETLLAGGANIDGPVGTRETALYLASRENNVDAVMVLISHDACLDMGQGMSNDTLRAAEEAYTKQLSCTKEEPTKRFEELIVEFDSWMGANRPDFYQGLNDPIARKRLDQFESTTGLKLPEEYRHLVGWRNGQPDNFIGTFHPFTDEAFMSLEATEQCISIMNGLLDSADMEETHWRRDWLPFMTDGGGNHTCIDLSPEHYGRIFGSDHECGGVQFLHDNLSLWLAELHAKLLYLDVVAWETGERA